MVLPILISNIFRGVSGVIPKVASRSPVGQVSKGYGGLIRSKPVQIGAVGAGIGAGGFGVGSAISSAQESIEKGGGGLMLLGGGLIAVIILIMLMRRK